MMQLSLSDGRLQVLVRLGHQTGLAVARSHLSPGTGWHHVYVGRRGKRLMMRVNHVDTVMINIGEGRGRGSLRTDGNVWIG